MESTRTAAALQVAASAAISVPDLARAPRKTRAPKRAKEDRGFVAVVRNFGEGPQVTFWGHTATPKCPIYGLVGALRSALAVETMGCDPKWGTHAWVLINGKWESTL